MRQDGWRVLVLTPEAYGGFGGISVYNVDLMDALCNLPYVATVTLLPRIIRETPQRLPDKIELVARGTRGISAYAAEASKQMRRRYDIVLCTHMYLLPFAKLANVFHRAPILCVLYGIEAWVPSKRMMVDQIVRSCDTLISISAYTEARFRAWSKVADERLALLPNCVHAERYGLGEKSEHLAQRYGTIGCRTIMTLGRLDARERQKGIDEMIAVMPRLLADSPDLRYLIAGDGDDRPRLEAKVQSMGLSGQVIFCGRVSDAEKADHYRLCDVFTMAGRQEGFGFVFLEALACGAPVVASVLDGSRDAVLGGELGELANPDDPSSLCDAIMRALAKPRQIPARLAHFSFENFVGRLDGILKPYRARQLTEPSARAGAAA